MLNTKKIAFDIDGVLADFAFSFTLLAHEMDNKLPVLSDSEVQGWNFVPWYCGEKTLGNIWGYMRKTLPLFWAGLTPLVDRRTFDRIYCSDREIYFITSRPDIGCVSSQSQSTHWLYTMGNFPITVPVICHSDKAEVCRLLNIDLYIDDKLENIEKFYEKPGIATDAYLLIKPYHKDLKVPYVYSVDEFLRKAGL